MLIQSVCIVHVGHSNGIDLLSGMTLLALDDEWSDKQSFNGWTLPQIPSLGLNE